MRPCAIIRRQCYRSILYRSSLHGAEKAPNSSISFNASSRRIPIAIFEFERAGHVLVLAHAPQTICSPLSFSTPLPPTGLRDMLAGPLWPVESASPPAAYPL